MVWYFAYCKLDEPTFYCRSTVLAATSDMLKVEILVKMKQDYIDELGHPQEKKGLHIKK